MKQRVFSGARPTGRQHIGNYIGAIENYVKLQETYDCVYCIVDIHALTTLENTSTLQQNIFEMTLDWLAAGIDPNKSIVFVQSHVPEVTELFTYLGMITPLGWLLRVPTFKEKARMQPENINYGLVGYPVLMAADIMLYKSDMVPVGEDQLPHLEMTREIVRRFNNLFGDTFPEPKAKLTNYPMVLGLNGSQKMGKSYDNHIELAATDEETYERVKMAVTDPARQRRKDVGHPEVCNVFSLHKFYNIERTQEIEVQCRKADIGCVECKKLLADGINKALHDFRKRRTSLSQNPAHIYDILDEGARRARIIARATLDEVKSKMGLIKNA
jgi:tryptophanyl-tRNA synthetase